MKLEFKRMLGSRGLKIAIGLGLLFVISHVQVVMHYAQMNKSVLGDDVMRIPFSAFMFFMGYDVYGWQGGIFFRMTPLLAALPYANSYFSDISEGYVKNIVSRANKKQYLVAKYLAIFTSGGIAVTVPLIADIMMCTALLPSYLPRVGSGLFSVGNSALYALYPYVYLVLFLLIDFVIGGLYAVTTLLATELIENKYLLLIFPYMLMVIWQMAGRLVGLDVCWPVTLAIPEGDHAGILVYVATIGGTLLVTFAVHYIRGMKRDEL